jgi:hypothetical protein
MKIISLLAIFLFSSQSWSSCLYQSDIDISFDQTLSSDVENYIKEMMEAKNHTLSSLPGVMTLSIYSDCYDGICYAMGGWGMAATSRSPRHMANPESLVWGVVGNLLKLIPKCQ